MEVKRKRVKMFREMVEQIGEIRTEGGRRREEVEGRSGGVEE